MRKPTKPTKPTLRLWLEAVERPSLIVTIDAELEPNGDSIFMVCQLLTETPLLDDIIGSEFDGDLQQGITEFGTGITEIERSGGRFVSKPGGLQIDQRSC